jgi:hypothetical protein
MLYRTILHHCTVLHYNELYYNVPYCTVPYRSYALLCAFSFFTTAWRNFLSMRGRLEVWLTAERGVGVT